jgi:hypothetical protein
MNLPIKGIASLTVISSALDRPVLENAGCDGCGRAIMVVSESGIGILICIWGVFRLNDLLLALLANRARRGRSPRRTLRTLGTRAFLGHGLKGETEYVRRRRRGGALRQYLGRRTFLCLVPPQHGVRDYENCWLSPSDVA